MRDFILSIDFFPFLASCLFIFAMWASRRKQNFKLDKIKASLEGLPRLSGMQSVPLSAMLPPAEQHQPVCLGRTLPGGLMFKGGLSDGAQIFADIALSRSTPSVYLGYNIAEAVLALADKAQKEGIYPGGRLVIPENVADLENMLEFHKLSCPWIVADAPEKIEDLVKINRRFGCPVLVVNSAAVPDNFAVIE